VDKKTFDYSYRRKNLDKVFLYTSAALLVASVMMVWQDYTREWKGYARKFGDLKYVELQKKKAKMERPIKKKLEKLGKEIKAALAAEEKQAEQIGAIKDSKQELKSEVEEQSLNYKNFKADYDAFKYQLVKAREERPNDLPEIEKQFEADTKKLEKLDNFGKGLRKKMADLDEKLGVFLRSRTEKENSITSLRSDIVLLEEQMALIEPGSLWYWLRNAPVLDLANPNLKIEQVILPHIERQLNYLTVGRVDRCQTCHKGIADKAFKNVDQPFQSHPRLDLFVGDSSPHPLEKFGCTTCHLGNGRETDFHYTDHTPSSPKQRDEWIEKYGWKKSKYWDEPMLPKQYVEASCHKCHKKEHFLPNTSSLAKGKELFVNLGCHGCHKVGGYEDLEKVGPSLTHIKSKLDPAWAKRWIEKPRALKPTSRMPQVFGLQNEDPSKQKVFVDTAVDSISYYIFEKSKTKSFGGSYTGGSAAAGKKVFETVGCQACHVVDKELTEARVGGRYFGPSLVGTGDKLKPAWIVAWLRNPRKWHSKVRMPDMRLSEAEIQNLTAYLMGLKGGYEPKTEMASETMMNELLTEFAKSSVTGEVYDPKISLDEKRLILGKKLIGHYGCFGCHEISGFEKTSRIGTELTAWGSKSPDKLAYGFLEPKKGHSDPRSSGGYENEKKHLPLEHYNWAWARQKLASPRIFDTHQENSFLDKLRMPRFGLHEEEIDYLVTFLLGQVRDNTDLSERKLSPVMALGYENELFIAQRNCIGCHKLNGYGGGIHKLTGDTGAPPPLNFHGARVRSKWLYSFLQNPERYRMRTWLKTRMPTFLFTGAELDKVVGYFRNTGGKQISIVEEGHRPRRSLYLSTGRTLFKGMACVNCHIPGGGSNPAIAAPPLSFAGKKLEFDWIQRWIRDPAKIIPGTRMPAFYGYDDEGNLRNNGGGLLADGHPFKDDPAKQIESLAEYVMSLGPTN